MAASRRVLDAGDKLFSAAAPSAAGRFSAPLRGGGFAPADQPRNARLPSTASEASAPAAA